MHRSGRTCCPKVNDSPAEQGAALGATHAAQQAVLCVHQSIIASPKCRQPCSDQHGPHGPLPAGRGSCAGAGRLAAAACGHRAAPAAEARSHWLPGPALGAFAGAAHNGPCRRRMMHGALCRMQCDAPPPPPPCTMSALLARVANRLTSSDCQRIQHALSPPPPISLPAT